jgi:malate dehydrogenase
MPKNKDFKRLVRERAARTGTSYSTARAQVLARNVDAPSRPLTVAVTGAGGRVAYNLLFRIAAGEVFGTSTPIDLRLVDVDDALLGLEGVVFELEDCASPVLRSIDVTSDYPAGFEQASWILALGAPRRLEGMERRDLLAATARSFAEQGRAVAATAAADVQVLVVGNPANTNCLVARRSAPDVPAERWHAMLRLDHNRARSQLAARAEVAVDRVRNVSIWGNHSPTMVPDAWHAIIDGRPAVDVVDVGWIEDVFIPLIQRRGAELIEISGASSAASAAAAVADAVRTVASGTAAGEWTTDGVVSHGEYGVPEGLQCGFPVVVRNGVATVVEGLALGAAQRRLLDLSVAELLEEQEVALRLSADAR